MMTNGLKECHRVNGKKKKKVTYISGSKKSQVKSKYKLTKYFHHKGQFFPSIQKGPKNKQKQRPTMYEK